MEPYPNKPVILPKTESIYINCVIVVTLKPSVSFFIVFIDLATMRQERHYRKPRERTKELPRRSINVRARTEMMQRRGYQSQHLYVFFLMNSEPQQDVEHSPTYTPRSIINTLLYFSFYYLACQTHVGCTNACD